MKSYYDRSDLCRFSYGPRPWRTTHALADASSDSSSCRTSSLSPLLIGGAVIGGVLLAMLNRHCSDPHRRFIQVAIGLTALSCVAPVALADTMASKVALIALHLVAAAIIVPVLARRAR